VRQRPEPSVAGSPAPPATWLDVSLGSVEQNLALDEALLELAHEGLTAAPCVRTWMATEPTVVLGSSSRIEEEIDLEACRGAGVRVVRRPSGGATVVLGPGCLMWSVIVPHPVAVPAVEAIHVAMLEPLAAALNATLTTLAGTAARRVARRGTSDLAVVSVGDATERKVSGNALRVRRHGVLYHGTLLDRFDLGLVGRVLRHPPREPEYRSRRRHGEFLANLDIGREPLEEAVRAAFGATLATLAWPDDRVARLVAERYSRHDWIFRL